MVTFNKLMGKSHNCSGGSTSNCTPCPQLPGTILRIFIPAGAVINLLNLIELDSPSGICFIVRLPFLEGESLTNTVQSLTDAVRRVGGTVERSQ